MPPSFSNSLSQKVLFNLLEKAPIGFLYFSGSWTVEFVNDNFFEFGTGIEPSKSQILGEDILKSGLTDKLEITEKLKDLERGMSFEKELQCIRTSGGGTISVIIKGVPVFDNDRFSGGILLLEDIKLADDLRENDISSNHLINIITKDISDIFFITDSELNTLYSYSSEKFSHLLKTDMLTGKINKIFGEIFNEDISETVSLAVASGGSAEKFFSAALGEDLYNFVVRIIPFPSENHTPASLIVYIKETFSHHEDAHLSLSEIAELKQYQFITSEVADAVIATDMEGNINFWNKSAEKLFYYSRSEVYGKFIGKVISNFSLEYFAQIKEEIQRHSAWESEIKFISYSGSEEYIYVTVSLSKQEDFSSVIFLCTSTTEQTKIERELRISEERFRNIVINANEFICNLDLEGNITYMNPSFIRAFEFTEGELLQRNITDLLDPGVNSQSFELDEFTGSQSKAIELCCRTKSGRQIFLLANFSPIIGFNNEPKYFNGIFTDITEKKEAEKELKTVRYVYEASRDGISVEVDRKFILVNDSFARMFGYDSSAELIGQDSLEIVADEDIRKVAGYISSREREEPAPNMYDFVGKRKDGSSFFVEASVTSYRSENKVCIVRTLRDITERKRSQEALKDSEEKYRSITENIDDFLWTAEVVNGRLRPVFYTSSVEKVTGYQQEEFLDSSNFWFKLIYPDDIELFKRKFRNLLQDQARYSDEIELRIVNKLGNIVWVKNKFKVIRNTGGRIVKLYGLVSDITLNKKAEEDLKKSAMELRELNSTKDKFISIISHDLRTPFSSILGFTDILLSEMDMSESQQTQYIKYIRESSENMLALVNSLLDWTRLQTGRVKFEPARIKAFEVINKSVSIVNGAALKKNITISSSVDPSLYIHADLNLLMQVVNNLLSNAIKFTKPDGSITIQAEFSDNFNKVEFIVSDTGTGIKMENLDKLFKVDSKFTLDGTAGEKGSGLGLSIVRDIIEKHGGEIWVESQYGKGSQFHFTIPVASAQILLVDDSRTDRLLYSKILKNIIPQYKIEEANNGREAFEAIIKSTPALVITDHNMPEMSGYELVKQLKFSDINGKPPVIILSGDVNKSIIEEYHELGIEYIFQKPVSLTTFKEAIEKSLKKALFN
ncbi:MAG: PAS domain S-box protein [Bacillota bacterium]